MRGTTIGLIVRRGLGQHRLSTAMMVLSAALASGLVMSVFSLTSQARRAFEGGSEGFDAILGARGSDLQLVLNTVFHLETSPGNVPWSLYHELAEDRRVARAVPYATGDSYYGFRVVGTTPERFADRDGAHPDRARVGSGRSFAPDRAEAVIGAVAAAETGLAIGDVFHPEHGTGGAAGHRHDDEYTVVGILDPTGSPSDRVVFIPIEGVFRMSGHVLHGGGEAYHPHPHEDIPDEHKEVSAVLLELRSPELGFELMNEIRRERSDATIAFPIERPIAELFRRLGWAHRVLEIVAYLVVVVSAAGLLASLYNTISERRREFAILRAIGATRRTVFGAVVAEAAWVAAVGALGGVASSFAVTGVARIVVRAEAGVVLEGMAFHPVHVLAPIGMIALGAAAGAIPAARAYATDVAENLVPRT